MPFKSDKETNYFSAIAPTAFGIPCLILGQKRFKASSSKELKIAIDPLYINRKPSLHKMVILVLVRRIQTL